MKWATSGEREVWWKRGGPDALALRSRGFGVRIPETAGQDYRKFGTLTSVCRGGRRADSGVSSGVSIMIQPEYSRESPFADKL